jgi:hypothetical protein
MSNLKEHVREQDEITAAWEARLRTPCERAQEIMDETDRLAADAHDYPNKRRAARAALTILPAYDDDTAEVGVQDLLTDLLHLCDLAGWNFSTIKDAAHRNYNREVADLGVAADDHMRRSLQEH